MKDSRYDGRRVVVPFPSPGWGGVVLGITDDDRAYAVEVIVPEPGAIAFIDAEDIEAFLVTASN